ncbi:MAG: RT0821/Lpp0805 family surface protein [Gammaproteobacteria bacterium]
MKKILITLALVVPLAACQTTDPHGQQTSGVNKQQAGTVVGGVLGGVLGSQIGDGKGQIAATIGGALLGGLLGGSVGASMDRNDEMRAYQAMENNRVGQVSTWRNPDTGSQVTVTPTRTYTGASGQTCREYDTRVTIDGRREDAHGTACRESDGSWRIVS